MYRNLLIFITLYTVIFSSWATTTGNTTTLPSSTELFILKIIKQKNSYYKAYVRTLNLKGQNTYGWVTYNSKDPHGKIFGINPIDKLTYAVKNINNAFYYVLTNETSFIKDISLIKSTDEGPILEKRLNDNIYTKLNNYLPISNYNTSELAQDLYNSCPNVPSRKNGMACHQAKAKNIPDVIKKVIKRIAKKYGQDPALITSIIHHESGFNSFIENQHEKKKCESNSNTCSPYKWGKGLSQLGATDAHFFGLDWNYNIKKPDVCNKSNILNLKCFTALQYTCKKFKKNTLKPISCPVASIEAVARKLKSLIPKTLPTWIKRHPGKDSNSKLINLSTVLAKSYVEKTRNLIGIYNRGVKVYNSFVEYYDYYGTFPDNFGTAWAMPRTSGSPSISMGYQMLTREYIGRCYVYELAGICGKMPEYALVRQYLNQF